MFFLRMEQRYVVFISLVKGHVFQNKKGGHELYILCLLTSRTKINSLVQLSFEWINMK